MHKILFASLLCSLSIASFAGSRMPQPNPPPTVQVEIAKGFNTIQCQEFPTQQQKVDEIHKQLKAANITTYNTRITNDGRMYPAMCGSPMGYLAVFKIAEKDLQTSQQFGFYLYKSP
jgi:hypothetical protein